jgi:hypothetical protein
MTMKSCATIAREKSSATLYCASLGGVRADPNTQTLRNWRYSENTFAA